MQTFKSSFVIFLGSSLLNSTASLPSAKPVLHKCDDIFKKFGSTVWLLSCPDFAVKGLKPDIPNACYISLLYVCVYITLVYRKNIAIFFFFLGGRTKRMDFFFNKHKRILKEILVTDDCFQTL